MPTMAALPIIGPPGGHKCLNGLCAANSGHHDRRDCGMSSNGQVTLW